MTSSLSNFARWKTVAAAGLGVLCLWAYWPTLVVMASAWVHDAQYSHGYLVPAFALVLLWLRRGRLKDVEFRLSGFGLPLLLTGCVLRLAASYLYVDWLDGFSLLPTLAGLFALFGGRGAFRWAWPAIAFLVFMIPLPYRVETMLSHPLQRVATVCSVYVMQTLGLPAVAEGNVILLTRGRIGIVEACSGLSMLLVFFALATAVVLVSRRPIADRVILLVSAVPIAVLANVARITVTGLAQELIDPTLAYRIFHDWGGWLMMPFALGLFLAEVWFLNHFFVQQTEADPIAAALGLPRAPSKPGSARQPSP